MSRLSLLHRFSILSMLSLFIANMVLGLTITYVLNQHAIESAKNLTAQIVLSEVKKDLSLQDLTSPHISDYEAFSEKIEHLTFGPDVVRVKIWGANKIVVWANDQRLIGQQFHDNHELDEAFAGEIEAEISTLDKLEHEFEQTFERLLEVYVPIRLAPGGEVVSVFEVYQNLDPVDANIAHLKEIVWGVSTIGFVVLYVLLFGIVRRASRQIDTQLQQIIVSEAKLKEHSDELEVKVEERTRELAEAKLAAESASKAKSDFLANMSHELRTPLNSVIGFSQALGDELAGPVNKEQREYLNDILESGRHLLTIINELLDLAKIESGKIELDYTEVDVTELVDKSVLIFKERSLQHNIPIEVSLSPEVETVECDFTRLRQIIINLLGNALKFTFDGGHVAVGACIINDDEGEKSLLVSVKDTGIGIKPEDQEKLFRPFAQLEPSLTKKYEGTGLGLVLSKNLVELHGGKIWIESSEGKGSTFSFTVPVKQPGRGDVKS